MFDSLTIYCLATGKPIAQINDDEVGCILESLGHIPVGQQAAHLERVALLSMRPSLLWMSVTPQSIQTLTESAPRQVLAYLLNRIYAPLERPQQNKLPDVESMLAARRMRVAIWESIESVSMQPDQLDSLLLVLLALDSQFGLTKLLVPSSIVSIWNNWTEDSASELLLRLWEWHNKLIKEREAAARRAKSQAEFWNGGGNKHTRESYVKQFAKVAPSPTAVARKEKALALKESVDFLDQLERELTQRGNGMASEAVASLSQSAPKKPIMRFGAAKKSEA